MKTNWVLSVYALNVLSRRGISEDVTRGVMDEPDRVEELSESLWAFRKSGHNGSADVEHIFIAEREPSQVRIITAYRQTTGNVA
jgi:hypothetical protein